MITIICSIGVAFVATLFATIVHNENIRLKKELEEAVSNDTRTLTHTYKVGGIKIVHVYHNQNGREKIIEVF